MHPLAVTIVGGLLVLTLWAALGGFVALFEDNKDDSDESTPSSSLTSTSTLPSTLSSSPGTSSSSTSTASPPSTTTTTATTAPPPPPSIHLLSPDNRYEFVTDRSYDMSIDESVSINGEDFGYGAAVGCGVACGSARPNYVEFDLGRDYSEFTAVVGLTDRSELCDPKELQIVVDGSPVFTKSFVVGQSERITLNVSGALSVRFLTEISDTHKYHPALGDPVAR